MNDIFTSKDVEKRCNFIYDDHNLPFNNVNLNHVNYLFILNTKYTFEEIVNIISSYEDVHFATLKSVNLLIENNKDFRKKIFELFDFYANYGLQINIIANNNITPFEIIHDIFCYNEVTSFTEYGICLDMSSLNRLWFDNSILKTIKQYINCGFDNKGNVYII